MELKNTEKFKVGDFVIIKTEIPNQKIIGKIEEITQEDGEKIFRYFEYYLPEKIFEAKIEHNSKYEVYKTEQIEKEYISNILKKCEVHKYEQFIRKIQIIKEKKNSNSSTIENILENNFFFRQTYNLKDHTFFPNIEPSCFCKKVFNPDKNFITCRECKELIHVECYVLSKNSKCSKCSNNIDNQLNHSGIGITDKYETYFINSQKKENNSNSSSNQEKLLGIKRGRSDSAEENMKKNESENLLRNKNKDVNKIKTNHPLISINYDYEKKTTNEEKVNYPNLSEERRKYLKSQIDKLEMATNNDLTDKSMKSEEKSRRIFRNKITHALLYGIEELKEYGTWEKIKNNDLKTQNINSMTATKICTNTAIAIESAIYFQNGESIQNKSYKNKFKTLLLNLMDHRNTELRFSILNGDISANELVKLSTEELAPSRIKSMRTERQNKYFKEQVLMKEEMKIILKNHKGESILNVDNDSHDEYDEKEKLISQDKDLSDDQNGGSENFKSEKLKQRDSNINMFDFDKKKFSLDYLNSNSGNPSNIIREHVPKIYPQKQNKTKEIKFKSLNQDMQDFCKLLDDYNKDILMNKLNEKLKSNLNLNTVKEIFDLERKLEINFNTKS